MRIYRTADAWPIARANTEAEHTRTDESDKQQRRDLNRRLAEKLVDGWSAYEYKEKFDAELQQALDGKHGGKFDVNAAKYARPITVQPQTFGAAANGGIAATEQRTKERLSQFTSVKLHGKKDWK